MLWKKIIYFTLISTSPDLTTTVTTLKKVEEGRRNLLFEGLVKSSKKCYLIHKAVSKFSFYLIDLKIKK